MSDATGAISQWANLHQVTLPRFALERAICNLDKIEALALIRAAYGATLPEAQAILTAIRERQPLEYG